MRTFILAASAAAALAAVPATAQETRAPFTGPRVEGLIGYDHVKNGGDDGSGSSNGLLYGVGAGYDLPVGRDLTIGAEGEFTDSTTNTRADDIFAAGDRLRIDAGRDLYVGGRLGYVLTPRTLVYAKAGYTNARVRERYYVGNARYSDHDNLDGYRLGIGLEQKLTPDTYIKGEYRYSHYGDVGGYDADLDRHQLLGGIGIRF